MLMYPLWSKMVSMHQKKITQKYCPSIAHLISIGIRLYANDAPPSCK